MNSQIARIQELKRQRQALLLSHYYEDGQIQDLADHVGDSLYLAQMGERTPHPVILLAGVVFMAESVKILAPEKTVIVPDLNAGCSLVQHSPFAAYLAWRRRHPQALAVTYINSSAEVKAISDVIVTSSNAEKIIAAIPRERQILFGPDRNLGRYLAQKTNRPMDLWPGACEVHVLFSARKIFELKTKHPKAVVLAHPECVDEVLNEAHVIGSTSRLLKEVQDNPAREFIVATEPGILHQMQKLRPEAQLISAPAEGSCACNECPYMKLNTLDKIEQALTTLKPAVFVDPAIAARARVALERMMHLTDGGNVEWPETFQDVEQPRVPVALAP